MSKAACNNPVHHLSLSYNSNYYEKMLPEINLQLTELQFYMNKIARCVCIVDVFSAGKCFSSVQHFHKCSTLLQINYLEITNLLIFYNNFRTSNRSMVPQGISVYRIFNNEGAKINSAKINSKSKHCKVSCYSNYFIFKKTRLTVYYFNKCFTF